MHGHTAKIISAKMVTPFRQRHKTDSNDALAVAEAASRPNVKEASMKPVEQKYAITRCRCGDQHDRIGCIARRWDDEHGTAHAGDARGHGSDDVASATIRANAAPLSRGLREDGCCKHRLSSRNNSPPACGHWLLVISNSAFYVLLDFSLFKTRS
jgi:hypothetical protein